jgi:hypothetical protein
MLGCKMIQTMKELSTRQAARLVCQLVRAGLSSYNLLGCLGHKQTRGEVVGGGGGARASGCLYFRLFVKYILCVFHLYRQFRTSSVGVGVYLFLSWDEKYLQPALNAANQRWYENGMYHRWPNSRSRPLFGRYQNLFVVSVPSTAFRLTAFFWTDLPLRRNFLPNW